MKLLNNLNRKGYLRRHFSEVEATIAKSVSQDVWETACDLHSVVQHHMVQTVFDMGINQESMTAYMGSILRAQEGPYQYHDYEILPANHGPPPPSEQEVRDMMQRRLEMWV